MRRLTVLLVPTALAACAARPDPLPATGTITTERLRSEIVGDDYILRIRLPPDADPDAAYPLVVQLDPTFAGLAQFDTTVGLVSQREADGDWPEAVVVGLDYDDPGTRQRDYIPTEPLSPDFDNDDGADRFYAALRDEILPHLDATLPVDPARRVLNGHSNGGVFSWYAALRHEDGTPPLFAAHIAGDNGYDASLFTLERWHAERASDLPIRLYASRATLNGPAQQITFDGLTERLRDRGFPSLALRTAVLDTDHGGAVAPSTDEGLAFAFSEEAP